MVMLPANWFNIKRRNRNNVTIFLFSTMLFAFCNFSHASLSLDELCKSSTSTVRIGLNEKQVTYSKRMHLRPLICFARDALGGNISIIRKDTSLPILPYRLPSIFYLPFPLVVLLKIRSKELEKQYGAHNVFPTERIVPIPLEITGTTILREATATTTPFVTEITEATSTTAETTTEETTTEETTIETTEETTSDETTTETTEETTTETTTEETTTEETTTEETTTEETTTEETTTETNTEETTTEETTTEETTTEETTTEETTTETTTEETTTEEITTEETTTEEITTEETTTEETTTEETTTEETTTETTEETTTEAESTTGIFP